MTDGRIQMERSKHDIEAEDRALSAHTQATIAAGYASSLLNTGRPVSLTSEEANALLEIVRQSADKAAAVALLWR